MDNRGERREREDGDRERIECLLLCESSAVSAVKTEEDQSVRPTHPSPDLTPRQDAAGCHGGWLSEMSAPVRQCTRFRPPAGFRLSFQGLAPPTFAYILATYVANVRLCPPFRRIFILSPHPGPLAIANHLAWAKMRRGSPGGSRRRPFSFGEKDRMRGNHGATCRRRATERAAVSSAGFPGDSRCLQTTHSFIYAIKTYVRNISPFRFRDSRGIFGFLNSERFREEESGCAHG